MRILTEEELDAVYGGGDAQSYTTLPKVNVTATRLSTTAGIYWEGAGSTGFGHDEFGGGSSTCWANVPSMPIHPMNLPSPAKMRCLIDHSAVAGHSLDPSYPLSVVDSWAWGKPDDTVPTGIQLGFTGFTNAPPDASGWVGYSGFTFSQHQGDNVRGSVSIFPSGIIEMNDLTSGPAILPNGVHYDQGYHFGRIYREDHVVITLGHEAAHQWAQLHGVTLTEAEAEGYGVQALINYQANRDAINGACKLL